MKVLVQPTYFPNIATFAAMLNADMICFEVCDNFQKQTYRNRSAIYAANGRLNLNVPVHHSHKNRQLTKDVKIVASENWQTHHLKSLHSAYSRSPFYEFYIDDLEPLFSRSFDFLTDFNFECLSAIFDCLQIPFKFETSHFFENHPKDAIDARMLSNARKEIIQDFDPYVQVFIENHGFISNLSVLDLLFNEGPNTLNYLKSQMVKLS